MGFLFCEEEEYEFRGDGPRPVFEAIERALEAAEAKRALRRGSNAAPALRPPEPRR
jgi:hypothetical protein